MERVSSLRDKLLIVLPQVYAVDTCSPWPRPIFHHKRELKTMFDKGRYSRNCLVICRFIYVLITFLFTSSANA